MQFHISHHLLFEFIKIHRYCLLFDVPSYKREVLFRILRDMVDDWGIPNVQFYYSNVCESEGLSMAGRFDGWTIVSCRLTSGEETAFHKWSEDQQKRKVDPIAEMAAKGLKLSLTWVDGSNAFCFSVTNRETKQTLTSWSDSWLEAAWISLYKIQVLFQGGAWYDRDSGAWG